MTPRNEAVVKRWSLFTVISGVTFRGLFRNENRNRAFEIVIVVLNKGLYYSDLAYVKVKNDEFRNFLKFFRFKLSKTKFLPPSSLVFHRFVQNKFTKFIFRR